MKLPLLAMTVAMMTASAAFAQSSSTPRNPNANPNNCSAAFPNCTGVNKTPGNSPGTARNTMRQEEKIPQTARNPNLPMKEHDCPANEPNCTVNWTSPDAGGSSGSQR